MQELNSRFCEITADLLTLSSTLNPKDAFRSFKIDDICNFVENYYPQDFIEQEICLLKRQLQHYELDVTKHPNFQNMGTISKLCRGLEISGKLKFYYLIDRPIHLVLTLSVSTTTTKRDFLAIKLLKTKHPNFQNVGTISKLCRGLDISVKLNLYYLIDRPIHLVLTLSISTTTTERAFSAIKLLKTRLCNRMENELLVDNMIVYIEKEIIENFTMEMIIDEFYSMKNCH